VLELGGIMFRFQHVPGEHHLLVDAEVGIEKGQENDERAKNQEAHFYPEILPLEEHFFVTKIEDEKPDKERQENAVVSAAEGLKDKEQAHAGEILIRRVVKKTMEEEETEKNPGEIEKFKMADMGHPEGTKGDDDASDDGGRPDSGEIKNEKIHSQGAEDK
jgi:hypothetical protein